MRIREKDMELLSAIMEVPREDFISQADLAERFGVDRGAIRRRLKKCQDLGLVVVVKAGRKNQRKYFVVVEKCTLYLQKFKKGVPGYILDYHRSIVKENNKNIYKSYSSIYPEGGFSQEMSQKVHFLKKRKTKNGLYFHFDGRWRSIKQVKKYARNEVKPFRYLCQSVKKFKMWQNPISGNMFFNFSWDCVQPVSPKDVEFIAMYREIARGTRFNHLTNVQILRLIEAYTPKFVFTKLGYLVSRADVIDANRRIRNLYAYFNTCLVEMYNNLCDVKEWLEYQGDRCPEIPFFATNGTVRIDVPRLKRVARYVVRPSGNARQFYRQVGIALADGFRYDVDSEQLEVIDRYKHNPVFDHFYQVFGFTDEFANRLLPVWINDSDDRYPSCLFNESGDYDPGYL